jgi:malonate-semialdehyde dehydrogenase (acetylating) / methylmalonate-semialdehyde dehydrogenase
MKMQALQPVSDISRQLGRSNLPVIEHFIDGQFTTHRSSRLGAVYNPSSGRQVAEVSFASTAVVNEAVAAAEAAFAPWAGMPAHVRARVLFRFRDFVEKNLDRLARLINWEHDAPRNL